MSGEKSSTLSMVCCISGSTSYKLAEMGKVFVLLGLLLVFEGVTCVVIGQPNDPGKYSSTKKHCKVTLLSKIQ